MLLLALWINKRDKFATRLAVVKSWHKCIPVLHDLCEFQGVVFCLPLLVSPLEQVSLPLPHSFHDYSHPPPPLFTTFVLHVHILIFMLMIQNGRQTQHTKHVCLNNLNTVCIQTSLKALFNQCNTTLLSVIQNIYIGCVVILHFHKWIMKKGQ